MKALRLYFLGPLSILCFQITAQVEDLMKDKNITWIAESYNDFMTDVTMEKELPKEISRLTSLKFLNINEKILPESFVLETLLMEAVKNPNSVIYKDANCQNPILYDSICEFESICQMFDPDQSYKGPKFFRHEPNPESVVFFKAHQILYYDSKKVQFGLRTIAIAPMIKKYDDDRN
jgi:hypothetical protein